MIELLRARQVLFVIAWAFPLVLFARQAWSAANDACDRLAAATWYTALSIVAFPIRWLLQSATVSQMPHDELVVWSALYVLGCMAAAYLTLAVHRVCHGR